MNVEEYLNSFYRGRKKPSLTAMQFFMEEFNHPEKELNVIHIAGTNGKGSCTEMMTNILIKAGFKVGKFISPHLVKYNERISIQNKNISDAEMEDLIKKIEPKIEKYQNKNNIKITFFELITTMAILYYYESKCDFVVLETGLGGLYDCTNIVNPLISVITSIGYDHMHILGNTLLEIAEQKAGIIKPNSDTVFAVCDEEDVNKKIMQTCIKNNNQLHTVENKNILNYSYNEDYQKFDYKKYKNIMINLKGEKQLLNSSMCIECVEILRKKNFLISDEALRSGLSTVIHKGRFETINKNPQIIYDGAHNEPAIENFCKSVKMYYTEQKKLYIVSILKTKDYKMMIKKLLEDEKGVFIFTTGNNSEKYVAKEELIKEAKQYTLNKNLYTKELEQAIEEIKEKYKDYVTFFVGSFYVYGTVTDKIKKIFK